MTMEIRITQAVNRLTGHVRRTPVLSAPALDAIAGHRVLVKAECLQHTGSFKYRGGLSAVTALSERAPGAPVLALSSGNHAQGVARAAAETGHAATILMPSDAPNAKIEGTRALGAEVILYDRFGQDRDALGQEISADRGLHLIHPFNDADVIAGQATAGVELSDQLGKAGIDSAEVLVCCGGGGLSSGIALALSQRRPGCRVRTVEPEAFDDVARSLEAGHPVANLPGASSICDAILTPSPGSLTFPVLHELCGPGLTVSDDMALEAMALAFKHLKIVLEPGGAVALAAALFMPETANTDTVVAVATGGNVDPATFQLALKNG